MRTARLSNSFVIGWIALLLVGNLLLPVHGQSAGTAEYEVYRCRHTKAADVERLLSGLLPAGSKFHLVSDAKSNSLLLQGSAEVQDVAKGLLAQVDRPSQGIDQEISGPSPQQPVVRAYPADPSQIDIRVRAIREFCAGRRDVRVTAAPDTGQIFVLGPPEIQNQIQGLLGRGPMRPATTQSVGSRVPAFDRNGVAGTTRPSGEAGRGPSIDQLIQVRSGRMDQVEQRLLALFGHRLQTRQQLGRDIYVLPIDAGVAIEFQVDTQRRAILVHGPSEVIQQFAKLVEAFDSTGDLGFQTRALRVERTAPSQVMKAVEAIRSDTPSRSSFGVPGTDNRSSQTGDSHRGAVRLVNYLFQEGQAGGAGDTVEPGQTATMPSGPGLQDLEIQTLSELGVIIVRGRDQDVRQFEQIIRELERLSLETRPKIQIYWLKHTLDESVKEIIDEVQVDLVGGRQGRVSVTVLGKPNALMLIGWGEAVASIVELIDKLDRPIAPESQFSVFALKHASATTVDQTIADFFRTRSGLGPKIQTAVDNRTNSLIVYAAPRDMLEVQRLVKSMDIARSNSVNRAQIFTLENTLAVDVAQTLEQTIAAVGTGQAGRTAVLELMVVDESGRQVLRSGMLDEVSVTPNSRNNTLIITGPNDAMGLVAAFIEQLDSPGDRALLKVYRIRNGDATNLVQMLRSLIPSQIGQAIGPQLPTALDESSLVPLRFSVEVRSNSIIAVGSEGDLRIVEALLTRLDESEAMNRRNAVYLLKNSPAVEVASTVNEFLRGQRMLAAAEPGQSNPFQDLEREVIVVAEPVGNRLVVSATPRYFDEIIELVEKLDEPPPQVMIQVLIAEIVLNDIDEFGFELGLQDSVLFDRSLLDDLVKTTRTSQVSDVNGILTSTQEIIESATNTPGFNFNGKEIGNSGSSDSLATAGSVGGQALSNFALGRVSSDLDFGGLVLSASNRNVSVLIRALQETRQIRILSRPTVRTLDNQPAFIQVGQRVPRIISTSVSQFGQTNNVDLENVGLILGLTPRISPDGNVVMEIDVEKSKVGPEDEGIPISVSVEGAIVRSPRVDTVTAQATVSAADGETVVMGGMIETRREVITRRAPYLADIPILGHLFRFDSEEERRTELLIILTPHVIRTPEDGEAIKQAEFARMNWCAADVYDIYGDVGMSFQSEVALPVDEDYHTEIVYPDINPRGNPQPHPAPSRQYQELPPVPDGGMPMRGDETFQRDLNLDPQRPAELPSAPIRQPLMPHRPADNRSGAWQPNGRFLSSQHVSSPPIRQPMPQSRSLPSGQVAAATTVYGPQPWNEQSDYRPAPTNDPVNQSVAENPSVRRW